MMTIETITNWLKEALQPARVTTVIDLGNDGEVQPSEADIMLQKVMSTLDLVKIHNLGNCYGGTDLEVINLPITAERLGDLSDLMKSVLMVNQSEILNPTLIYTYEGGNNRRVSIENGGSCVEFNIAPEDSGYITSCTWNDGTQQMTFMTPEGFYADFLYLSQLGLNPV